MMNNEKRGEDFFLARDKRGRNRNFSLCAFPKNRRGLSTVVIALILIVVSLVAIGVIWVIVQNLINQSSKQIEGISGGLTLNLDIVNAFEQSGQIIVDVKRSVGAGNLVKIKFILSDDSNSEVIDKDTTMKELEENNFYLTPAKLTSTKVTTVSVAPVYRASDGTETTGSITDTFYLTNGHVVNSGTSSEACNPSCSPAYHCVAGKCVQCSIATDCGPPGSGYYCDSSGTCKLSNYEECSQSCNPPNICVNGNCVQCSDDTMCDQAGGYTCINGVCAPPTCLTNPKKVEDTPEQACNNDHNRVCGSTTDNCGTNVNCPPGSDGKCPPGQICSDSGQCFTDLINSGTIGSVWPESAPTYFDSVDLPKDGTEINLIFKAINFPGSSEPGCLQVFNAEHLTVPGYDETHIQLDRVANIKSGDNYNIWRTTDCGASSR